MVASASVWAGFRRARLLAVAWIAALAGLASMPAPAASGPSLAARRADFAEFIRLVDENYAWPQREGRPWTTWGTRYAAAVDGADGAQAFAAVLAAALDELHDFHAEVRSRQSNRWLPVPTFADLWVEPEGTLARIVAVRRGSDAERAGLRVGDAVVAVGGLPLAQALRARLGAVSPASDEANRWALLSLMAGRSEESRHFDVIDAAGSLRKVVLPVERQFTRPAGAVQSRLLEGNLGYLRINNALGEQATVAAFDAALESLRATRGLVLDLRDVPSGGDSSVALGILGRFVHEMRPYQRHRIVNYGQADVERNWLELVAPRGPFTYEAPVVVLVDHWTGSMGEGMAIGMDALGRATVVGTPMAGLAGAVSDFTLPRTGTRFAIATEQIFHVDGTRRQDWRPPVLVREGPAPGDAVLERGLALLRDAEGR